MSETLVPKDSFTAKVVMICNMYELPPAILENMSVNEHRDYVIDRLVYSIKSYLLAGGEETVDCDLRWPADWWQAMRERWAPRFILRRWPVRYREHVQHRTFYRTMCPHISIPKHQGNEIHFMFLKNGDRA